jgi:L-amino acid N-acyltransferase YncA
MARDTPALSASALMERPRDLRAVSSAAARDEVRVSDTTVTIVAILLIIVAMKVRAATEGDAAACAAIYTPYVTDTTITFEFEPPTVEQMAERITAAERTHAWLVLENLEDGRVVGYAYAGPYKSRPAYSWSCEVSIYLETGRRRTGGGRVLYEALFRRLAERGYRTAVAGMALPNDASAGLHRALGFEPVGTYRNIGWKHGRWLDVAWMQRTLTEAVDPPIEPR